MFDFLIGKDKDQYLKEYDDAIDKTRQDRADAEYQYHYNKALYDANKDYFNEIGVQDPTTSYWDENSQKVNALTDSMNKYDKYIGQLKDEKQTVAEKQKYNKFGDGLIPAMLGLNDWNQYLDMSNEFGKVLQKAGHNVFTGDYSVDPTEEWEKRDHLSDAGATIGAALSILPVVGATAGVAKGAATGAAKTLGKTLLKGAATGAAYGGVGSLGQYLQENGKNSTLGGALGTTATGALAGGAIGGAASGIGYGVNNLANRAQTTRALQDLYNQTYNVPNALGDGVNGATTTNPTVEWLLNRDDLAKSKLGQAAQGLKDTISYRNLVNGGSNNKIQNLIRKVGSTKTGKIAAGAGGGLLLAQLLRGNENNNNNNMSNEEIYNYIYRGGQ